jgi:hypothetical protein
MKTKSKIYKISIFYEDRQEQNEKKYENTEERPAPLIKR